jgi:TolA-binding protein
VVDAYHSLAEGYVLDGHHVEAEQLLRAVIADRDRILGPEHPETLDSRPRYWLGRALQGQGRDSEAADVFASLLKKQATMLGADHPATVDTRTQLAGATANL